MDLEHPDITRTLRTGYPKKEVPATTDTNQNTQVECITEKYIDLYEKLRKSGKTPQDSFTSTVGKLVFDDNAEIDMLEDLYFRYEKDSEVFVND